MSIAHDQWPQIHTQGGTVAIGGPITSGTATAVLYVGAGGVIAEDPTNFYYNDTLKKLFVAGQVFADDLVLDETAARVAKISASYLQFQINNSVRWEMDYSGNLIPKNAIDVDIGSAVIGVDIGYFNRFVSQPSVNNRGVLNKVLYGATTDAATAVELTTDGAAGSGATNRIAVPTDTGMSVVLHLLVKQSASADAKQMLRQFCISNNGGVVALQGTPIAIGTDTGSAGLATVAITITANDTDNCIKVEVNGVIGTLLRYSAWLESVEAFYA